MSENLRGTIARLDRELEQWKDRFDGSELAHAATLADLRDCRSELTEARACEMEMFCDLGQARMELEQARQDAKQSDLDAIRALGERNDARAELARIKAILADPLAVHLNMMRGEIKWTPANLRHLLGDCQPTPADD